MRLSWTFLFAVHIHVVLAQQDNVLLPGDAMLAGLHEVTTNEDGSCNHVISQSIQTQEAVRWFFGLLNERNYIPEVTLGYHAFQTCGQKSRAVQQTLKILDMYDAKHDNSTYLMGLLGPHRSSEAQTVSRLLSSLPVEDRLPQIIYSATAASLSDRTVYKNLYRVIETDDTQVEVIVQLMQALQWNYVGIVYEDDTYGRDGAEALRTKAQNVSICIPIFTVISAQASTADRRSKFISIVRKIEKESESPVLGVVFFGKGTTAEIMIDSISVELELENFQLIVSEALALDPAYVHGGNGDVYSRAKGLLNPTPPYYDVELFRQHWVDLHTNGTAMLQQIKDNDWLLQYMREITKSDERCSLTLQSPIDDACLETATKYIQSNERLSMFTHYALLGAATFAKTLKDFRLKECDPFTGLCSKLKGLPRSSVSETMAHINVSLSAEFNFELPNLNQSFQFMNGDIHYEADDELTTYDVYNFQKCGSPFCFLKIGAHINGQLSINSNVTKSYSRRGREMDFVKAQCQGSFSCDSCRAMGRYGKIFHVRGDFYIIGLVPIHNRNPSGLNCGDLRVSSLSLDLAEAMHYAVNTLNTREGILNRITGNFTFGLVLIDTCVHPYVTQERVIHLNDGTLKLNNYLNSSGILDKIIGYVGPAHSSVSVPFASLMNEVKMLYISYSATSSSLSNRQRFPYFMRASSPDHKQARVIIELAKMMDSKYVQIIYSDEEYGRAGRDALLKAAKEDAICVAQNLSVPDTTDTRKFQRYNSDIRTYPHAKVIIVFLLPHIFPGFMGILSRNVGQKEFVFIGGEGWAQREELLLYNNEFNSNLRGSLTITQKLPKDSGFEEYYNTVDIQESPNPWLQDYMEARANCYFPKSFYKIYNKACTVSLTAQHRQTDAWVPFTINTVHALALGFHSAVTSACGAVTLCEEYTTEKLIQHTKRVHLDIYNNNNSIRIFDDNGEGSVGYTVSQIFRTGKRLEYKEIALSSETGINLLVPLQTVKTEADFTSVCPNKYECNRCQGQFHLPSMTTSSGSFPVVTVSIAVVGSVLLLALVIVSICLCRCAKLRTQTEDPYLSVVPDPRLDSAHTSYGTAMNTIDSDVDSGYARAFPVFDQTELPT